MPYAVSLCLDASSAGRVEALWRALAEAGVSDRMPSLNYRPHLTLGVYDALDPEAAAGSLGRFAAGRLPLPVAFAGLGLFAAADEGVLWAAPVPDAALLAVHADLHRALPLECRAHYRVGRWVPHCTLAMGFDRHGLQAAVAATLPLWRPFAGRLDRLDLVRFNPVEVLWEARLGG